MLETWSMHPRDVALAVGATLVALGGVYLLIEVRASGAKPPPPEAVEEAQLRHARSSTTAAASRPALGGAPESDAPPRGSGSGSGAFSRGALRPRHPAIKGGAPVDTPAELGGDRFPGGADKPGSGSAVDVDLDARLLEANKAYDRKDFEGARALALKLLQDEAPGNVRMLRVVVSSSCILGEGDVAQKYASELPQFDKDQMTTRCAQYGVALK